MTLPVEGTPTPGQPNATEDPIIRAALGELQMILNGFGSDDNFASGFPGSKLVAGSVPPGAMNLPMLGLRAPTARAKTSDAAQVTTTSTTHVALGASSITLTQPNPGLTFFFGGFEVEYTGAGSAPGFQVGIDIDAGLRNVEAFNSTWWPFNGASLGTGVWQLAYFNTPEAYDSFSNPTGDTNAIRPVDIPGAHTCKLTYRLNVATAGLQFRNRWLAAIAVGF